MASEIEDNEVDDDYEAPLSDDDADDFVDDADPADDADDTDDTDDDEIDLDEELAASPKEKAARALEIRRALEVRDEQRRLSEDLDYLEFDDE